MGKAVQGIQETAEEGSNNNRRRGTKKKRGIVYWKQSADLIHTWNSSGSCDQRHLHLHHRRRRYLLLLLARTTRPRRAGTSRWQQHSSSSLAKTQPKIKGKGAIAPSETPDPPTTVAEYRGRTHSAWQGTVQGSTSPTSTKYKRHLGGSESIMENPNVTSETGALTFTPPSSISTRAKLHSNKNENASLKRLYDDFHSDRTPEEILRAGSLGPTRRFWLA
jgi:hypothetical protein